MIDWGQWSPTCLVSLNGKQRWRIIMCNFCWFVLFWLSWMSFVTVASGIFWQKNSKRALEKCRPRPTGGRAVHISLQGKKQSPGKTVTGLCHVNLYRKNHWHTTTTTTKTCRPHLGCDHTHTHTDSVTVPGSPARLAITAPAFLAQGAALPPLPLPLSPPGTGPAGRRRWRGVLGQFVLIPPHPNRPPTRNSTRRTVTCRPVFSYSVFQ